MFGIQLKHPPFSHRTVSASERALNCGFLSSVRGHRKPPQEQKECVRITLPGKGDIHIRDIYHQK